MVLAATGYKDGAHRKVARAECKARVAAASLVPSSSDLPVRV